MRLIVFSDSHGRLDYALRVLKEAGKPDLILHAGDNYRDGLRLAEITGLPVKAVPGNCDQGEQEPLELLLELAGYRILMTLTQVRQLPSTPGMAIRTPER